MRCTAVAIPLLLLGPAAHALGPSRARSALFGSNAAGEAVPAGAIVLMFADPVFVAHDLGSPDPSRAWGIAETVVAGAQLAVFTVLLADSYANPDGRGLQNTVSWIFIAGSAALGAHGIWAIVRSPAAEVSLAPAPGGAALAVSF